MENNIEHLSDERMPTVINRRTAIDRITKITKLVCNRDFKSIGNITYEINPSFNMNSLYSEYEFFNYYYDYSDSKVVGGFENKTLQHIINSPFYRFSCVNEYVIEDVDVDKKELHVDQIDLDNFYNNILNIKHLYNCELGTKGIDFYKYKYLRGCNEGLFLDRRIHAVNISSEMVSSSVCILVDYVPTFIIRVSRVVKGFEISFAYETCLNSKSYSFYTSIEYNERLPENIKKLFNIVISQVNLISANKKDTSDKISNDYIIDLVNTI